MTTFTPDTPSFSKVLKDKVVVLTGGASGIGAAAIRLLHSAGAKIVFGDLDEKGAQDTIAATSSEDVHFLRCDVREYSDNLALFKLALSKYGQVDHAIANAGIIEQGGWFNPHASLEDLETPPNLLVLDVNLKGVLYFAQIACSYLAHGNHSTPPLDKSLTLLASVAGFKESPGLFAYQTSKHGVLGLMRAMRPFVPKVYAGLRVNAVCPSMTLTRMVLGIEQGWLDAKLPVNSPEDVGKVLVGLAAAGPGTKTIKQNVAVQNQSNTGALDWDAQSEKGSQGVNGRGLYVCGGDCWDIEEGLDRTQHLWLGKEPSNVLVAAQRALGDGTQWVTNKE